MNLTLRNQLLISNHSKNVEMNFRTEYNGRVNIEPLDISRPVVLLGSCFTTSIGERMRACRWRAYPNPCGVLYNPLSIARVLEIAMTGNPERELAGSIVERDGRWVSWLTDSKVSGTLPEECIGLLRDLFDGLKKRLEECATVIVTFGTSWIYELADRKNYVVANCHKFPEKIFVRRRITPDEISGRWTGLINAVNMKFGKKRFIFTVSPIRHLRDGFEGNSVSKASLLLGCTDICGRMEGVGYFPSFEIMNDDLRDYRFYASDMLHPSETAVDYIWSKFRQEFISDGDGRILDEGEKVTKALSHRPIVAGGSCGETGRNLEFSSQALERLALFLDRHPGMLGIE